MQVLDKREATRQPPPPQQAKEAFSVQLHSEMAMRSEIIMEPRTPAQTKKQKQLKI